MDILELIIRTVTELPEDVLYHLARIRGHPLGDAIWENINIASKERKPICQDTGLHTFVIETKDLSSKELREIIQEARNAIREATLKGFLRPNAIERPHRNTGDNIAEGNPHFIIRLSDRNRLWFLPKGGGSIAVSRFYTLRPTEGIEEVRKLILKSIVDAGGKACPPYFVFAAAGGTEESSMTEAKLLMLTDLRSERDEFESSTLRMANELGIGIMGTGSGPTVLDLRAKRLAKHPAVTSLAIIISCRALRRGYLDL